MSLLLVVERTLSDRPGAVIKVGYVGLCVLCLIASGLLLKLAM